MTTRNAAPYLALLAGVLVTTALGSIHAFSVFIFSLEQSFSASRTQVSLVYSLALVTLTIFVLFGYRIYPKLSATKLIVLSCGVASVGLALAASVSNFVILILGYSVLFGAANGVGYGFVLQLVAHALPQKQGFAMGTVTAAYAVGASIFAKLIAFIIATQGYRIALITMAVILAVIALLAGILVKLSKASYNAKEPSSDSQLDKSDGSLLRLGLGYGLGVAAGLMVIGHAAAIISSRDPNHAVTGVILIGIGNAAGGLFAGLLADRWPVKRLLIGLPILSTGMLLLLALFTGGVATIFSIAIIGFCYGAIIAVYPVAVMLKYGPMQSAQAYGRVFIAWGIAGLGAPWLAGWMFDKTGSYTAAFVLAGIAAVASAVLIGRATLTPSRNN